jgi:hypothetical protein
MAEKRVEKIDHGLRHAGRFDQQPEEYEQGNGQKNNVRHALVDAAHDDAHRRARGDGEEGECGEREHEGNGRAREHAGADKKDKEHDELVVADRHQRRLEQPQGRADRDDEGKREHDIEEAAEAREA